MLEEVKVLRDCKVLVPNKEHKNFTETKEEIKEGKVLNGRFVNINGKRRGEDFTYRLFITDKEKIIYQNCVKPMKTTEVMLGADSQVSPTVVDLTGAERRKKAKTMGLLVGAGLGFAYSKLYKKESWKKVAMFTALGAGIGFAAAYLVKNKITVEESK